MASVVRRHWSWLAGAVVACGGCSCDDALPPGPVGDGGRVEDGGSPTRDGARADADVNADAGPMAASDGGPDARITPRDAGPGETFWAIVEGSPSDDVAHDVGTTTGGDVVVVGEMGGRMQFGDDVLDPVGASDGFVGTFVADGTPRGGFRFGGDDSDGARAVELTTPRFVLAGTMEVTPGSTDLYGARFGSGLPLTGMTLGSTGLDDAADVAGELGGPLFVVGTAAGSLAGGPMAIGRDGMVARLEGAPDRVAFETLFRGPNETRIDGVAWGPTLWIGGSFDTSIEHGGTVLLTTSPGETDAFVAELDPASGEPVRAVAFGGAGVDAVYDVARSAGGVIACGAFSGSLTIDAVSLTSAGGTDAFILVLDDAGAAVWGMRFGGSGDDVARRVVIATDGTVYAIGAFRGRLEPSGPSATGGADVLVVAIDATGGLRWVTTFGSAADDEGTGVDAFYGGVAVAGWVSGPIDFHDGIGPRWFEGSRDAFVALLGR